MEPSIFTRIINGELPCHKIFEDDRTFAFLDIHPVQPGHVLVVSKTQVDRFEDLNESDYLALVATLKRVMHRVVEVFGPEYRACLKTEGFEVPHVHVNVIPCRAPTDFYAKPTAEPDHTDLAEIAKRLVF